jgi:hypothetical protein
LFNDRSIGLKRIGLSDSKERRPVGRLSVTRPLDNLDHAIVELVNVELVNVELAKAEQAAPLSVPKLKLIETAPKPVEDSLDPISAVATVYRTMQ